jgi:hypothetical protein
VRQFTAIRAHRLDDGVAASRAAPSAETAMTDLERIALRLRQRALQCYEYLLFAMLLALATGVVLTAAAAAREDSAQCGNIQSSAPVIKR